MMEKLEHKYFFLRSTLNFDKTPDFVLDKMQLKRIILHALETLHGQVGAAIMVDIISCECLPSTVRAILRVQNRDLIKLWSALTLLGCYGNWGCVFQVTKMSASLMGLAVDSRQFATDLLHSHRT